MSHIKFFNSSGMLLWMSIIPLRVDRSFTGIICTYILIYKSTFSIGLCSNLNPDWQCNKFAITIIATITERDFKSEFLFRVCSVVINLLTSLEIYPIGCTTMLTQFGRTRNAYVATRLILLSRTAESNATSGYVVVPERFGQGEARAGRNE